MITIRKARQEEAETLAEIGLRAWQKAMIPVGETLDMTENARNAFLRFARDGWICITVIEKSGQPAGWAAREDLDETITDFWIDPDFEGQGLGTELLAAVEAEIVDKGFSKASLQTHAMNAQALRFFKKHGYAVNWLTVTYNPKLDRDVQSVGLSKQLAQQETRGYGQEF
ncbi:acetyltransferase [Rhizobium sp. Root274]|uniref:GNAT family N-acetyltransferase n=1 Tax=unclassified Rhizobium TaxID=2613769 RepID=UPI0007130347|nr:MULTISPECIES: GNAT family N-acetyltransferase [unclassified Rhizobium]KQW30835.1 acetyltransferase [Rhizobium sp. Root1240]KRD32380.1 acetyltransferase [Rhizobium sp. Root274]